MKIVNHRDKSVTVTLNHEQAQELWCLVREGRKAMVREYAAYDSTTALDFMRGVERAGGEIQHAHLQRSGGQ